MRPAATRRAPDAPLAIPRAWPPTSAGRSRRADATTGRRTLLEDAALGDLADLAELGLDRALEVLLRERRVLLGGEERRAQRCVADVAAGQPVLARELGEIERA